MQIPTLTIFQSHQSWTIPCWIVCHTPNHHCHLQSYQTKLARGLRKPKRREKVVSHLHTLDFGIHGSFCNHLEDLREARGESFLVLPCFSNYASSCTVLLYHASPKLKLFAKNTCKSFFDNFWTLVGKPFNKHNQVLPL